MIGPNKGGQPCDEANLDTQYIMGILPSPPNRGENSCTLAQGHGTVVLGLIVVTALGRNVDTFSLNIDRPQNIYQAIIKWSAEVNSMEKPPLVSAIVRFLKHSLLNR